MYNFENMEENLKSGKNLPKIFGNPGLGFMTFIFLLLL